MPALTNPKKAAVQALKTLNHDLEHSLRRIDQYERGIQDLPYTPETADDEYKALSKRAITNVCGFMTASPAQMLYVDSFRRGRTSAGTADFGSGAVNKMQPEMDHWQNSRMDARQNAVVYGALKFGHSFVLTEKVNDRVLSKGLSALKTVALFADPANDDDATAALTVIDWPEMQGPESDRTVGVARMFDTVNEYDVLFEGLDDPDSVVVALVGPHGARRCPITRFTAAVDLEGRTCGVVEPLFVLQDRINQTVFDLLIVQSYASFKVRTVAGMTPPFKVRPIDEEGNEVLHPRENDERIVEWIPVVGPDGKPVPDEIHLNAKRLLIAADVQTKFGTMDETPLDGFISAIELAFRHMSAISQTPPHYILGEISNISAEALNAAETSLLRKVEQFKKSFGESWERVFRVAAEIGDYAGADDFAGEVLWRDMSNVSLAQTADALGKFGTQLGIPLEGLWSRVPNVTATELAHWRELKAQETPEQALAAATRKGAATNTGRPSFRLGDQTTAPAPTG